MSTPNELFTAEEQDILSPYVTNTNRSVFVLTNLPEVIKGALFSRYSLPNLVLEHCFLKNLSIKKNLSSIKFEAEIITKIHQIISLIPSGKVATYGQIAEIVGRCSALMVGYATSAIPKDSDIPWQRVINYKGGISQRTSGSGGLLQQKLLEA